VQERVRQKKEYDVVINDRDILGTQLIRRNDELAGPDSARHVINTHVKPSSLSSMASFNVAFNIY
jgi:hypothetical protein